MGPAAQVLNTVPKADSRKKPLKSAQNAGSASSQFKRRTPGIPGIRIGAGYRFPHRNHSVHCNTVDFCSPRHSGMHPRHSGSLHPESRVLSSLPACTGTRKRKGHSLVWSGTETARRICGRHGERRAAISPKQTGPTAAPRQSDPAQVTSGRPRADSKGYLNRPARLRNSGLNIRFMNRVPKAMAVAGGSMCEVAWL